MSLPPLVYQYKKYCDCLTGFKRTGIIDLQSQSFLPPSFTLPLAVLIAENLDCKRIMPSNPSARSYLYTLLGTKIEDRRSRTYVPLVKLPADAAGASDVLQILYDVQKDDSSAFGGEMAFKYVVGELVDNIYEHSKFKLAFVMAQRYPNLGYLELVFIDNGITIQGSYKQHNMTFKPWQAIIKALEGLSTKSSERGFGLRTSIKLFREGLKGTILIVSGRGAVYIDGSKILPYRLAMAERMKGTLIAMRVPYPCPLVDIYKYIE